MSKSSIRSKVSIRSLSRQKKKKLGNVRGKKEIGFCCGPGNFDPLFKYNQRRLPFKSSLTAIESVHECPVLKFRTQFFENVVASSKKKGNKAKQKFSKEHLEWEDSENSTSAPGTFQRFIEDEIQSIISKEALKKLIAFKNASKKYIKMGKKRAREKEIKSKAKTHPHWYQDFSISQMNHLMALENALCEDYKEKATFRTQETLSEIGITSTFFKLVPGQIKSLQQKSDTRPVEFLREVYKIISGADFETEGYKNEYNCNERLTLTAIAFLCLPETIIELHKRLPPVKIPQILPKPKLPKVDYPTKMDCPYKETLFVPPNLRLYKIELNTWRKNYKMIPKPKIILPLKEKYSICMSEKQNSNRETEKVNNEEIKKIRKNTIIKYRVREKSMKSTRKKSAKLLRKKNLKKRETNQQIKLKNYSVSKEKQSDWDIRTRTNDASCHSMSANESTKVTLNNSNEKFFAKLENSQTKIYPHGRKGLSKNWQEWLRNVDEEFLKVEEEANNLIESVKTTMKLVNYDSACDHCCPCSKIKKSEFSDLISDHLMYNDYEEGEEWEEEETEGEERENEGKEGKEEGEEKEKKEVETEIEGKKCEEISKTHEVNTETIISNGNNNQRKSNFSAKEINTIYENNVNSTQRQFSSPEKINEPQKKKTNSRNSEIILPKKNLKNKENKIKQNSFPSSKNKRINSEYYHKRQSILKELNTYPPDRNKSKISKNNNQIKLSRNLNPKRVEKLKKKSKAGNELKYPQTNTLEIKEFPESQIEISENSEIKPFSCKTELGKISAPEKTLIYITDPIRPIESIKVKPGGKPCHCRENRDEKKISPRRSDEYIPEYELYESPYGTCVKTKTEANEIKAKEIKNQLLSKTENSNNWDEALKDHGLVDFYSQAQNNVPCWLKNSKPHTKKIRKLQVKIPVCECNYERKTVMKNEETEKLLNRQKRLKSYKKVPITHIAGISRPMEIDKKFIISGVKNVAKENGDEIQYCISGVAENCQMGPIQYLVNGVCMHTPIVTPKPSETSVSVPIHETPSEMQLTEKFIPTKKNNNRNKQRQKLNTNKQVEKNKKSKKLDTDARKFDAEKYKKLDEEKYGEIDDKMKFVNIEKQKMEDGNKIENGRNSKNETRHEMSNSKRVSYSNTDGANVDSDVNDPNLDLHQGLNEIQLNVSNSQRNLQSNKVIGKVGKHVDELDLRQLVADEIKKMASEGYIFAKLPKCCNFPQLNYWIMYRKGVFFSEQDKGKLIKRSVQTWIKLKAHNLLLKPPAFNLNKKEISELKFENVLNLKRKIAEMKGQFYKQIREDRVRRSANLWNTIEFGKFPSVWFKKTFFTYLPAKETDGHILEPHEI